MNASLVCCETCMRALNVFYLTGALPSKPPATEPNDSFCYLINKNLSFLYVIRISEKLPMLNHTCSHPAHSPDSKSGEQRSQEVQKGPREMMWGKIPNQKNPVCKSGIKKMDKADALLSKTGCSSLQIWMFSQSTRMFCPS